MGRRRRRRTGLPRPQRDDGLRTRRPPISALGKTVDALHTGDIARRGPDGLYEVIGRSSRFVKMYGLRIDLQRVEAALREHGVTAFCTDDDDRLVVAAAGHDEQRGPTRRRQPLPGCPGRRRAGGHASRSCRCCRRASRTTRRCATSRARRTRDEPNVIGLRGVVRRRAADRRQPASIPTPASSTSAAIRCPTSRCRCGWNARWASCQPTGSGCRCGSWRPCRNRRAGGGRGGARRWRPASRCAPRRSCSSSARTPELFELWGGAHLLLGIAGYNFGRFCLTPVPRADRVRHLRNTIAWIAVPSVVWVAIALMLTDDYTPTNLLLANKFLGPHDSMTAGRLWFVEVLVWILVALALVCWLPAVDRLERRRPFAVRGRRSWRSGWRCATTSSGWTWAATRGSRCWRSGSSRSAGRRRRRRRRWQRVAVTVVLIVGLHGYFDSTFARSAGARPASCCSSGCRRSGARPR